MNRKNKEQRVRILSCLIEGNSIRGTARITNTSKATVLKLLIDAGRACEKYQRAILTKLPCTNIEIDEIWSFVHSKSKNSKLKKHGDIWTWVAICSDTKLVPSWVVGKRHLKEAHELLGDLSTRLSNKIQLTTDGYKAYIDAVEDAFGNDIDYAMLIKIYEKKSGGFNICTGIKKRRINGNPDIDKVSTSCIERQNLTMRTNIKRMTRSTNAFSKKIENHRYATALHFMYYNFVRIHRSLGVTPVMAADVDPRMWDLGDIIDMTDVYND